VEKYNLKVKYYIRELKREDLDKDLRPLPQIVQNHHDIRKSILDDHWEMRLPMLKKAMKTGMYGILVVFEEGYNIPIAFLDYWIIYCFVENANLCLLQNMRVIEHSRGKGIGRALVRKLKRVARKRGCTEIHVVAGEGADGFYHKMGFAYKDTFLEMKIDGNDS